MRGGWGEDGRALSFGAIADRCYSNIPHCRFFGFFSCPCGLGPWRTFQRRCIHTDTHTQSNAHTSFNPNSYAHSGSCADTDSYSYSHKDRNAYAGSDDSCGHRANAIGRDRG